MEVIYLKTLTDNGTKIRGAYKVVLNDLSLKAAFLVEFYKKLDKKGLVITDKQYSKSDYGQEVGLKLNFYNGYKKSIKYINLTIRPYNRVNDITSDALGKSTSSAKVIGPLNYGEESSVEFDNLFWNNDEIIDCLRITKMEVIFIDNNKIVITDINSHLFPGVSNCKSLGKR